MPATLLNFYGDPGFSMGYEFGSSGSVGQIELNNVYVPGSSGPAYGVKMPLPKPSGWTADRAYFFLKSVTGTPPSPISCWLQQEHASASTQAGTVIARVDSNLTLPVAGGRWIEFDISPHWSSINSLHGLWFVCGFHSTASPAPSASEKAEAQHSSATAKPNRLMNGFTTTNGFSGAGTGTNGAIFALRYTDGAGNYRTYGQTVTAASTPSSTAEVRALGGSGFPFDFEIGSLLVAANIPNSATIMKVWINKAPNQTPDHSFNMDLFFQRQGVLWLPSPVVVPANAEFAVGLHLQSAQSAPGLVRIEDASRYGPHLRNAYGFDQGEIGAWRAAISDSSWDKTTHQNELWRMNMTVRRLESAGGSSRRGVSRGRLIA